MMSHNNVPNLVVASTTASVACGIVINRKSTYIMVSALRFEMFKEVQSSLSTT